MLLRESHASRLKTNPGNCASLSGETGGGSGGVIDSMLIHQRAPRRGKKQPKASISRSHAAGKKTLRVISDVTRKQQGASSNEFENKSARLSGEQENNLDKF